jgi:hypothetical protein
MAGEWPQRTRSPDGRRQKVEARDPKLGEFEEASEVIADGQGRSGVRAERGPRQSDHPHAERGVHTRFQLAA